MSNLKLEKPPIVEAVLDLDCDMRPGWELAAIEARAYDAYRESYPKFRAQVLHEHQIEAAGGSPPKVSVRRGLQAFQFLHDDERQLVQARVSGFSFNRLAPYTSLDDYLPEIERTWGLYRQVAGPVQVVAVRLRYINRILLPLAEGSVDLDDYLAAGPRLPVEESLRFAGFVDRHSMFEAATGHRVDVTLATQPEEADGLPIILDIQTVAPGTADPEDWQMIEGRVRALRALKNLVFRRTLTERCLRLFQSP
jgi:uncharacterized protein (TIGR04255 family)